ncbi:unnamed protein product [Phytomonas sp. EM1]|nr:unnamed protein product [Phytomonas sp. EM1]|eukprot:CCW65462.1 unnamed protein product [Phytomonas sp. isolate EM1]
MRRTGPQLYKIPKNMGVAPRYDIWNEKYEPWVHMKRMGRLVGTGFYIPPEWYNHFRMFPPINHNFQEEKTLNPHNESEPTQDQTDHLTAERIALRDELARKSRLVASEGMRYYNIFWVRKPLDRMEKEYYDLKRGGMPHEDAIQKVLSGFYNDLTVKKRVAAIQAEEAKLSGKFISMREATVVMSVLVQLQREQLMPHQVSLLADKQRKAAQEGGGLTAVVTRASTPTEECTSPPTEDATLSAESLADFLSNDMSGSAASENYSIKIKDTPDDSVERLRQRSMDNTGQPNWYTGTTAPLNWNAKEEE